MRWEAKKKKSCFPESVPICLKEVNLKFFLTLFLKEKVCGDLCLEPSWQAGSNEGSQQIFVFRYTENCPLSILLPLGTNVHYKNGCRDKNKDCPQIKGL